MRIFKDQHRFYMGTVVVSNEKMDGNPLGTLTVTRRLLNTSRRGPQNDRPVPKSCNISPSLSFRFGKFSTKINSCWLNFELFHVGTWNNHI